MTARKTKRVSVTIHGCEGEGKSLTEARKDALARIERTFAESYVPYVLRWRTMTAIVFREPEGWCTHYLHDEHDYTRPTPVYAAPNNRDRDSALATAALNLAQCGWSEGDGDRTPDVLTPYQHLLSEYRNWVRFQLRYRDAARMGMSDYDAHSYAGRNPARQDLFPAVDTGRPRVTRSGPFNYVVKVDSEPKAVVNVLVTPDGEKFQTVYTNDQTETLFPTMPEALAAVANYLAYDKIVLTDQ